MIGGIFFFNHRGDALISRSYRDDIGSNVIDLFRVNVIHLRGQDGPRAPIVDIGGTSFLHIRKGTIWIMACASSNISAAMVFEILINVANTLMSYLGQLTEDAIINNFVLIYEILDEILDYGYPQFLDSTSLKSFVTQQGISSLPIERAFTILPRKPSVANLSNVTGRIGWREEGLKYRKNELFLDIQESIHLLMSSQGTVLSAHVVGRVVMRSTLSGMPKCKFGINDKFLEAKVAKKHPFRLPTNNKYIAVDDCHFHQCVELGAFEKDHIITFVPPDGEFELMRYRITDDIIIPFKVTPLIDMIGSSKLYVKVILKSTFKPSLVATNIEVTIPVPPSTIGLEMLTTLLGKAKYKPGDNAIKWRINNLPGNVEAHLSAELSLFQTEASKKWKRQPVSVSFQVPFAPSGLKVRFLRVFEPKLNYNDKDVVKWVGYSGHSGSYEIRC